jgi:hypothetical protein
VTHVELEPAALGIAVIREEEEKERGEEKGRTLTQNDLLEPTAGLDFLSAFALPCGLEPPPPQKWRDDVLRGGR